MKKLISGILFILSVLIFTPVSASAAYALIYDGTEKLETYSVARETEFFEQLSSQYQIEFRIDIVSDLNGYTLSEVANSFYGTYDYGYGETKEGVLLMLQLRDNDTDVDFVDYHLLYSGERDEIKEFAPILLQETSSQLNEAAWSGNIDDDNESFRLLCHRYAESVNSFFGGVEKLANNSDLADLKTTYIKDLGGLITDGEAASLGETASRIAEQYQCGLYIVTVPDYKQYGITITDCTKNIYRDLGLGYGSEQNGFILCMSTSDRDYAFLAYGDFANTALSEFAYDSISASFKSKFQDDQWNEGFEKYLSESTVALEKAAAGEPWDFSNDTLSQVLLNFIIFIPLLIFGLFLSYVTNSRIMRKMQPVAEASHASAFVDLDKVKISIRRQRYIRTDIRRTYNPPRSSSSSSSGYGSSGSSGGGFSGGSGKY